MFTPKPQSVTRWSRWRLVASWALWLLVFLTLFRPGVGLVSLFLMFAAGIVRPRLMKHATDNERLQAAFGVLLVGPVIAVLFGYSPAMVFMQSAAGRAVLLTLWLATVLSDIQFFRELSAPRKPAGSEGSEQN